ncbi:MAG: hypothetical protein U9Q83_06055, partial [Bacteroidota bacterium]|nr:hypothetical protein [Bacteroidota bacterium]
MKIIKYIILVNLIIIIFFSCFKQKANDELKTQQILSYISDLQLDFDTLNSGILLHRTYNGIGGYFSEGDLIEVCFTGIYLDPNNGDNNGYFAQDDTFKFVIGNREILNGWNEIPKYFGKGG